MHKHGVFSIFHCLKFVALLLCNFHCRNILRSLSKLPQSIKHLEDIRSETYLKFFLIYYIICVHKATELCVLILPTILPTLPDSLLSLIPKLTMQVLAMC